MKISGKLEWTDCLAAERLHQRPAGAQKLVRYVVTALVVLAAAWVIYYAADNDPYGLLLAAVLIVLYAGGLLTNRFLVLPRRARRLYEQQKGLQVPFVHEITPAALISTDEFGHGERPWSHFLKWREDKDILLLYLTDIQSVLIPKRFTTEEQIQALRERLQEHNIRKVGS